MVVMFKWFCKNKNESNESEVKKTEEVNKVKKTNNYKTEENGDIEIKIEKDSTIGWKTYTDSFVIPKSSIVSHTENNIVLKDYRYYYNLNTYCWGEYYKAHNKSINNKQNFIKYKETQLKTYEYSKEDKCWKLTHEDTIATEIEYEKTPLEIFREEYKSKYKLIETEDEFNEYMASALDCDTWCRKKLYDKMKELGLGDGFINQFADLVGNDLDKYHAMIDLANEVFDTDTLMYLYTYKFGKK